MRNLLIVLLLAVAACGGSGSETPIAKPLPKPDPKPEPLPVVERDTFPLQPGEKLNPDSVVKYLRGDVFIPKGIYDLGNAKLVSDTLAGPLNIKGDSAVFTNCRSITLFSSLTATGITFRDVARAWVFKYLGDTISVDIRNCVFDDFAGAALLFAGDTAIMGEVTVLDNVFINARDRTSTLAFQGLLTKGAHIEDNLFKDYNPGFYSTIILGDPIFPFQSKKLQVTNNVWENVKSNKEDDGGRYITLMYGSEMVISGNTYKGISSAAGYLRGGDGVITRNTVFMEDANDDAGVFILKGQLDLPGRWEVSFNQVDGDIKPFLYDESKHPLYVAKNTYGGHTRKIVDVHGSLGVLDHPLFKAKKDIAIFEDNHFVNTNPTGLGITYKNVDSVIMRRNLIECPRHVVGTYLASDSINELKYLCIDQERWEASSGSFAQSLRSEVIEFIGPELTSGKSVRYPFNQIDADTIIGESTIKLQGDTSTLRKLIRPSI